MAERGDVEKSQLFLNFLSPAKDIPVSTLLTKVRYMDFKMAVAILAT